MSEQTTSNLAGGEDGTTLPPSQPEQFIRTPILMSIFIFFYALIFLLGLTGNCLVAFVVIRNKAMQTITNIFITNLAISDVLLCLLAVPFTPISYFLQSWIFGKALCHLVPTMLCICVYVSTLTSTAIAVDRYFVIVHPFKSRMKLYMCVLMIVAIWIISTSISLPLGIYHAVERSNESDTYECGEHWPKPQARQFFTVTSLVLQFLVPCSITSFCYIMVSLALRKRAKVKIGSGARSREREEMEIKRKKRTNKMLIAMVVIFVLCWMPLNMVHLIRDSDKTLQDWYFYTLFFFLSHVIAMSSTIYNPFLYAWMNDNFKKEFRQILPCLFFFGRGRSGHTSSYTQYTSVETQQQPSVIVNRSPKRNGNDNAILMKNLKLNNSYENESEKIQLAVLNKEENLHPENRNASKEQHEDAVLLVDNNKQHEDKNDVEQQQQQQQQQQQPNKQLDKNYTDGGGVYAPGVLETDA